jgi:hypothetical protein
MKYIVEGRFTFGDHASLFALDHESMCEISKERAKRFATKEEAHRIAAREKALRPGLRLLVIGVEK